MVNKAIALGKVVKKTCTGGHATDKDQLTSPLSDPDAAARFFCQGCGTVSTLTRKGAEDLLAQTKHPDNQDLEGYYFQVTRCIACSDVFAGVSLQRI